MPPKSKRVLPGKRYPLNMRTTKELRDKIEEAAMASGRSLVQEVEFRLERSLRQQEIEREMKNALDAWAESYRHELIGEMQKMFEAFQRARGLTDEEIAAAAQRPSLLDLVEPSEQPKGESGQPPDLRGSPDDTSEQLDRKEDAK
jgi:TraY domain